VSRGELIGIAGCTGWCTGTHLHFELRYDGLPIDPTLLMVG
jgi:murein DD-endopeptidase MepM/ murein hydrolase activator NlpD